MRIEGKARKKQKQQQQQQKCATTSFKETTAINVSQNISNDTLPEHTERNCYKEADNNKFRRKQTEKLNSILQILSRVITSTMRLSYANCI